MSKPVERWRDKYSRRTAVAGPDYEAGIRAPSRDPIKAAIDAKATWQAKMADPATAAKWSDALSYVGIDGWQKAALEKGTARYGPGITFGLPKYEDFASKFKAHLDRELPAIRAMKKVTIEDSVAKAAAMIRAAAKFVYKKR